MPIRNFNVGVRNAINGEPLELHFLDLIDDKVTFDWWSGTLEVSNLVEEVVNRVKVERPSLIKCIINSQGGSAAIGLAVYNFLKAYPATVEVEVIGMAASIASVIAQAATKGKRLIARNGFMVIHRAWGLGEGNSDDLRAAADVIDTFTGNIVDVYVQHTGKSSEEIEALIANGDYWMTGSQAIALGFADDYLEENSGFQIAACVATLDKQYYKNVPANLATAPVTAPVTTDQDDATTDTDTPVEDVVITTTEKAPKAPGNIATTTQNAKKMSFKDRVTNFINGVKNKTIKAPTGDENIAGAVANELAEPMEQMMSAVHEDIVSRETALETKIMDAVKTQYENRIATLETVNASLTQENKDLKQAEAEKVGGEAGVGEAKNSATSTNWAAAAGMEKVKVS